MVAMPETLTRVPYHPGDSLAGAIEDRKTTRYELSKRTGISQTAIGEIIAGKRGITARNALLIARFFGTSVEFWMGLQTDYDLDVARAKLGARLEKVEPLPLADEDA
jgi:addiction module HigA family antidote